jgi:GAF domain-containing protein
MDVKGRSESFLARIVSTVSSSLELDDVLESVVRLLTEASAVHACFVYLVDDAEDALILRAASDPFGHLTGKIRLDRGEGLAWWAIEQRKPAFVPDELLADPRVKYVAELEEERYQSLLCVPVQARDGSPIGVVSAHSEAPHEFTSDEVDFIVSAASLVAGAIENARLYEQTRRRVRELEALTALAEAIAGADTLEELLPAAADGARQILGATTTHLYLIEPGGDELVRARSSPAQATAAERLGLSGLGPQLAPRTRRGRLSVPLVAESELVGLLVAEGSRSVELARAIASQLAVGIRKVRLIEHLTERTFITDFLDELAAGRPLGDLDVRAARLGCDLSEPHVVVAAEPGSEAVEKAVRTALPGAITDRRDDRVRALVRLPRGGSDAVATALAAAVADLDDVHVGMSSPCAGPGSYAEAFVETAHALAATAVLAPPGKVLAYGDIGPYRYLLPIAGGTSTRDEMVARIARLAAYDADRQTQLLPTLEEFLHRRGSIAATSEALFVHQNTLRQRLRRIAEVADVDLRRDDWLTVEIAVKLVRLRASLAGRPSA